MDAIHWIIVAVVIAGLVIWYLKTKKSSASPEEPEEPTTPTSPPQPPTTSAM